MRAPGVRIGDRLGPFAACLDPDLLVRYAAATKDPSPAVQRGEASPPVALVTQIWAAQETGRVALVAPEILEHFTGGVHGEHDVRLHRPVRPGEPLRVFVEGHGVRQSGDRSFVTLRYTIVDADDATVAEQWWTTVYFGTTCAAIGEPAPEHAFPAAARDHPIGTYAIDVDHDMARRYAEVSGDWSAHHFDLAAARQSGVERRFLHGLCTMALCAQGVVELAADGDAERVRRVAVRFASPTYLGEALRVRVYDAGDLGVAFEAECTDTTVIAHGRAELF